MVDFLLEIGFEEFPTGYINKAASELLEKVEDLFKRERIFYRTMRKIYTSRRIGVLVLGVAKKQKPQPIVIQGPPKKFAYDENGKPTQTLEGFLNAHGLKLSDIKIVKTEKGEYVIATKEMPAKDTEDILYYEIPKIIASLEFPKTMVWNGNKVRFPRPIRWIVGLLDRKPLRFKYAGLEAERYTMPNFHFSFKPIRMEKPREYMNFLRHGGVIADPNERRKIIKNRIHEKARILKGEPVYDENMIEEINCTVEYPDVTYGEFDQEFLKLPEEILQSTLRALGNLIWIKGTNNFICIFNGRKKAAQNVGLGYARVLKSRLQDALFYYQNDLKQGIEKMLEGTKEMVWLEGLGTVYDKSIRLVKSIEYFESIPDLDIKSLKRAAELCKADLCSSMVREKEFTALQGVMGYYYARASGEKEKVAIIIKEHYLPAFSGDRIPITKEGAVLALIDRVDNILGALLSGQRPSGSYDPLGVRRNAYGIFNIVDQHKLDIELLPIFWEHLKLFKKDIDKKMVQEFLIERAERYLEELGYRYDEVDATIYNTNLNLYDTRLRCEALKDFRDKEDFTKLVIGQKRVRNILKNIKEIGEVNPELFEKSEEKNLYERGQEVEKKMTPLFAEKKYTEILILLLGLRKDIDRFFDEVLVMCEDKNLQKNRLALVNYINQLFLKFADLSKIVIEGEKGKEDSKPKT
ncbi:MAG: glycine--tRNA ligase subunit beta [candidate division WOR-3 bacterium]|nr:glycine--tRNA ligase subunit beta [candidate division WOR-3 bacterium]